MVGIPDSPVASWHTSPFAVQWASGNFGESPGTVMLCAKRLKSGIL